MAKNDQDAPIRSETPTPVTIAEYARPAQFLALERAVQIADILIVYVSGAFEISALLKAFDELFELTDRIRPRVAIIHGLGISGTLNVVDRYEFGVYGARKMSMAGHRFSLILCVPEFLLDPERFAQKVAATRGLETRIATDFQEALDLAQVPFSAADLVSPTTGW